MASYIVSSGVTREGIILGGTMEVLCGGMANNTIIKEWSYLCAYSGGTANNTTVSSTGHLCVSSGGIANSTTINSSGWLEVRHGGMADNTTVNSYGSMAVSSGGTANSTTVNAYSWLYVSSGATALAVKENGGYVEVADGASATFLSNSFSGLVLYSGSHGSAFLHSGTTANSTIVNSSCMMTVSSGGTANSTTVNDGSMYVSGGVADNTTVNSGWMHVSSGGVANSTTVNASSWLYVSSGATALAVKENGGYVEVADGASATFLSNSFSGLVLSRYNSTTLHSGTTANSTTVNEGGGMSVSSGGTANNTTINGWGWIWVYSGGVANSTNINPDGGITVRSGGTVNETTNTGYLWISSGGTANNTTINDWGSVDVYGGVANETTVKSFGIMRVSSGGTANSTTVNDGSMYVSSGVASDTTVNDGGKMYVSSGGAISGSLQITFGAIVSAYQGAIIDFTVAEQSSPSTALINDWSLISGGTNADYTITVKADQEYGTYVLAEGAADFANTITVKTTDDTELGTILIGGTLTSGKTTYSLNKNASILSLDVLHAHDEVKLYSGLTLVSSAQVMTGETLAYGSTDFMHVSSGGTANSTTTLNYGEIDVSSGGVANSTTVNDGGRLYVSGGVANSTTLNFSGSMVVFSDGTANDTMINSSGLLWVAGGGTANSTTVNDGGGMEVDCFGTALDVKENGGYVHVAEGASVTFLSNSFSGLVLSLYNSTTLHSGTTANNTTVNSYGYLYVSSGGTANSTTLNSCGEMDVLSGGVANSTTLNSDGLLHVECDGAANDTMINSGGNMFVWSGGTANNTAVDKGYLGVSNGGVANDTTINSGGSMSVWGSVANHTTVNDGGGMTVNGIASSTTVNSGGSVEVYGCVDSTIVETSGSMYVSSGGMASSTTLWGGVMSVDGTAYNTINDGYLYVHDGGLAYDTIINWGYYLYVQNGGTVWDTIINGGSMHVSSGGTANHTTVNSYGWLWVSSGGTADSTTVNDGSMYVSGGVADNTTVSSGGSMYVSGGGTANSTTVSSGGSMYVSSGGTALAVKEDGGYVEVAEGASVTFLVNSFCGLILSEWATLHSGTMATDTTLNGGKLYVSSGGVADNTTVNVGGGMYVSSGGAAYRTTVNDCGKMYVSSGGVANDTTINDGGGMYVSSGGVANRTTINAGYWGAGNLYVSNGGVAYRTTVNNCGNLYVSSDGEANDTTVNDGGGMYVSGVHSGSLQITSGATVSAYQGAIIDFTVAEQSTPSTALINDWSLISGGADADYTITVNPDQTYGTYVLADGAADFGNTITVKTTDDTELGTISTASKLIVGKGLYSLVKNNGILTLNIETMTPITITADSASKTYDGTALTTSGYTYTGTLATGDELVATISGSQTDAGTGVSTVSNYKVMRGETEVTANYTFNDSIDGTLEVSKRNITLASADDTKTYDGTPLTNHNVTVSGDGWADGEGAAYSVTGAQTEVGSSANAFSYTLNDGTEADNYSVTTKEGTLTVTMISTQPITITVDTLSKPYDGSALEATYSFTQGILLDGDQLIVTLDHTSLTDAGSCTVSVTDYKVMRGEVDVTAGYTFADSVSGSLTVTKSAVPITITAKSGSKTYDGTELSLNEFTYTGTLVAGDELVVTVAGTRTDAGTSDNIVSNYKVMRGEQDVTGNYTFNDPVKGTLTVTKRQVSLISNTASRKYDGTALEGTVAISGDGFVSGEATVSAGSLTNAGIIINHITLTEGPGYKAENYDISKAEGLLSVTKREVTLTSGDAAKVYDGTALTNDSVTAGGDGFIGNDSYVASVTGKQTAIGSSANTFTYTLTNGALEENYNITKIEGELSVSGAVVDSITGNFTGKGGILELNSNGCAYIRTDDAVTPLAGSIDISALEIAGAGDFNGGGNDGLLWLEKSTGNVYAQYDMTSFIEILGKENRIGLVEEGYSIKGCGDFSGFGIDGVLLQGPVFGDSSVSLNYGLPVWARESDGTTFNGWLGALVNTWKEGDTLKGDLSDPASINANNYQYKVVGVGDFNGDGRDDVMLQNTMPTTVDGHTITGSGDVFTFLTGDKAAIVSGAAPTVCYAGCATGGWDILGFGDFNDDGVTDTLLSDGTGLAGWSMSNGQRQSDFWFGNLTADQEVAGIADFNNDGTDDILIRDTAGTLTAWTVQNGSVTGSLAIQ